MPDAGKNSLMSFSLHFERRSTFRDGCYFPGLQTNCKFHSNYMLHAASDGLPILPQTMKMPCQFTAHCLSYQHTQIQANMPFIFVYNPSFVNKDLWDLSIVYAITVLAMLVSQWSSVFLLLVKPSNTSMFCVIGI